MGTFDEQPRGLSISGINEAQARELVGLEPDVAREVYQQAIDNAAGKVTAATISATRERIVIPDTVRRRKPLTDSYRDAMSDLEKVVAKLDRLTMDARFKRNAVEIDKANGGRLYSLQRELGQLLDYLNEATEEPA